MLRSNLLISNAYSIDLTAGMGGEKCGLGPGRRTCRNSGSSSARHLQEANSTACLTGIRGGRNPSPAIGGTPEHHGRAARNPAESDEKGAFRFYDNRQKYLLFVNTCSEKWVVSERAGMELGLVHPRPPALRVFDAGMGDGTVLTGVMRNMHRRFPTMPFYVVGKEISVEDVRLCLEKMPDRLFEHPATVLVVTNMHYSEAPSLQPRSMQAAATLNWIETPLVGNTSHEFHEQIAALQPTLADTWRVRPSPKTGNPLYVRASVLVLYREDHKFLLDPVIPRPGRASDGYDLILASQPYRARMPVDFKVKRVLAPLARSLAPGGRLLCIQSHGGDPGLEIVRKIWSDEQPFQSDRHVLLKALKEEIRQEPARSQVQRLFRQARDLPL